MNRFPLWKNLLVGLILVIGLTYTLPNFFGEAPAVQVAPNRSAEKPTPELMQRVEAALKGANISSPGISLDSSGVKARLTSPDEQVRAKDVLQAALGPTYTVALNLIPASPSWLTSLGALPMYLGLDLRGGVHFLLQVDMPGALTKAAERTAGDLRSALREKKVRYSAITREGDTVRIRFSAAEVRSEARTLIEAHYPDLQLNDTTEGADLLLVASLKEVARRKVGEDALQQNLTTLRNRVNELGVAEPVIQQQGADRIVVQLPGVQDTAKAKEILGRTASLEIRMVDDERMDDPAALAAAANGQVPFGDEAYPERDGRLILVKKEVVLTGEYITDAQPGFDQNSRSAVHITLDGRGARIFKNVTRENVGKRMAILLIEKGRTEVVTAPVIQEEIGGGRVQITGMDSAEDARDVSLLLRSGALAAPMEIIEERTVGPSMGAENIEKGFQSNIWGFVAVVVFMVFYYRVFGVFSSLSLAANGLFLIAILSMLQATLTLPGMAAIALTLGMAIDANVLINERIREELRNGNSPQAAITAGYERAFGTILDSNITTFIAGFALFWLGSGPVRGFAVVLCLGILTSIFSAVTVSRALVNLTYGRQARLGKLPI
ncbi:MAG: protein translocase subunit SecD [Betaproteobacteria bacterium]|nr:MAG: protein translocase subunit SecD [Betaproteobacteria bacterium]